MLLIFKVGVATPLALVKRTYTTWPVAIFKALKPGMFASFAAVAAAVVQVPYQLEPPLPPPPLTVLCF